MLEQLAEIAAERGVHRFDAEVLGTNRPMLLVFERAGFAVRRKGTFGELTVSLDITPSEEVRERIDARDHVAAVVSLRPILAPRSIAVVGASGSARRPRCRGAEGHPRRWFSRHRHAGQPDRRGRLLDALRAGP